MPRVPRPALLLATAFLVRLVYVHQTADIPYFNVPLVDGANYVRLAETIAGGDLLAGRQVFWQPPLYPYFLALLLSIFGTRMASIYVVQAAIGALTCLLTYLVGRRVFGERAGTAAGLVVAFYGPLIHFDAQPLIPVLHLVLVLAGVWALLRGRWPWAGLLWGLAAIATPNILFAVPPAAAWIWTARRGAAGAPGPAAGAGRRGPAACALLFLAGVALPVAVVAARNLAVSGEPVLISSNGGINFFIGNNPDYERTIRIRPGGEFERLAQEPENLGIVSARGRSRYFAARAWGFLTGYPKQALRLYGRKVLDLIAGREIPRNQDQYVYRDSSALFSILLWRFGVSFPFGVLAPLALAGLFVTDRRDPEGPPLVRLLVWTAAAYALSILVFFPTDRYRLPLVPILALFAGGLLAAGRAAWKRPAVLAALFAGLVVFNLDAFRPRETFPEEEALNRAYALRQKGDAAGAAAEYRRAIALNPDRIDAYNSLAAMAAGDGRWEEAERRYRELLERAPDFIEVRRNLGQALLAQGRVEEAREQWKLAAGRAPGAGLALADLCLSYLGEGLLLAAEPYCDRAVRARPDLGETHLAMGLLARALRRREVARAELEQAVRLLPAGAPGRAKAGEILERMRRRDAAGEAAGDATVD